jgi:hypothetical protein
MNTLKKSTALTVAIVAFVLANCAPQASAGLINNMLRTDGYGRVGISFVYGGVTNKVMTSTNGVTNPTLIKNGLVYQPCALIGTAPASLPVCNPQYGSTSSALPPGTPSGNFYYVRSGAGGLFSITNFLTGGASADNPELESRLNILPADCASANLEVMPVFSDAHSGSVVVTGSATAGTAIWLRCYEFLGDGAPADFDDLRANSVLKYDVTTSGPATFDPQNCTALTIPFTFDGDQSNLYFVLDTVAKSNPFNITCPSNVTFTCTEAVVFPDAQVTGGCGPITGTWNPPVGSAFPVGVTPVTVTATDEAGNSASCTFTVTITDSEAPTAPPLPTLTGESSVTVPVPPPVTDNCGGTITATTTDPLVYNTQGTFTVHWTYNDGNGNSTTADQTVIVDDVTAPVPPQLPTVTGQCSATVTVPTATDNVVGSVTGTTSDPLTYSSQGTFIVQWTFDDGNGNTSAANQTVIVKDTIAPVAPTLPSVTGSCSSPVVLTAPTATDNCAGVVTGTTSDPLTYSSQGTYTVQWTFSDGHGNTSTANQTVVVSGLTFLGFYSPIGGTNGTCSSPLRTINQGSNIPIKFDLMCGTSYVTGGQPPIVKIQQWSNCAYVGEPVSVNAVYQNDWHYNWDTTGWAKGIYKVIVVLPDGTSRYAFVRLK